MSVRSGSCTPVCTHTHPLGTLDLSSKIHLGGDFHPDSKAERRPSAAKRAPPPRASLPACVATQILHSQRSRLQGCRREGTGPGGLPAHLAGTELSKSRGRRARNPERLLAPLTYHPPAPAPQRVGPGQGSRRPTADHVSPRAVTAPEPPCHLGGVKKPEILPACSAQLPPREQARALGCWALQEPGGCRSPAVGEAAARVQRVVCSEQRTASDVGRGMHRNSARVLAATALLTQEGSASRHQKQIHRLPQHTLPPQKAAGSLHHLVSSSHTSSALATAERRAPTSAGTLLASATALCRRPRSCSAPRALQRRAPGL